MWLADKAAYAIRHPVTAGRLLRTHFLEATGYNSEQWARVAMYRELGPLVESLGSDLEALEISPGNPNAPWAKVSYRRLTTLSFPEFDICKDRTEERFDLIVADQVFEHLARPWDAAANVHAMLKPGGAFLVTTPFLVRVHPVPIDCSRWTENGLKELLVNSGFSPGDIHTGAWGNMACVVANLRSANWARFGWGKDLTNDPIFPVCVWAIARKATIPA